MALKNVVIHGFRSYGIKRKIDFSIPDGINPGSGLNIFLGPNNGGKSTIIESSIFEFYNDTISSIILIVGIIVRITNT